MWKPSHKSIHDTRASVHVLRILQAYLITVGVISAQKKMLSVLTA